MLTVVLAVLDVLVLLVLVRRVVLEAFQGLGPTISLAVVVGRAVP